MSTQRAASGPQVMPGRGQRCQWYGVVVETLTRPDLSRIGREYSVESLLMRVLPMRKADRARAAVNAR